ncbi:MAG TPA: fibronectin type III domain-containing protein [Acidobacteriaceae bacterium]|nr:fibronectin type III domain-containing protein [Acidobacteriaceae bacterium]
MTGCGTPGPPQPPSLQLPQPVTDLTAVRAGDSVTLHWTMPRKTTDHLRLKSPVTAQVCWREKGDSCQRVGETAFAPGAASAFVATLPDSLSQGDARPVSWFVELKNSKGHSAGPSNNAEVLAGKAPNAIAGLAAEVRADGVALHWNDGESGSVRLHRKLLSAPAQPVPNAKPKNALAQPEAEPLLSDLFVEASTAGALDRTAKFGASYEYTAQRVRRVMLQGKPLELAGPVSAPIRIDVADAFPPSVPQGLVAVLVPEEKTIDLSWQPDTDSYTDRDLAGYIVYRAEAGQQESSQDWKRISGSQPLPGPAYRDTQVTPGHQYRYAVTAIDLGGHESKRSHEARESVPNP